MSVGEGWRRLARVGESWRGLAKVGETWRVLEGVGYGWRVCGALGCVCHLKFCLLHGLDLWNRRI